jgi:predicted hydrocarbon binding protein
MSPIQKSGFRYPNIIGHVFLAAMEKEIGRSRMNEVFNLSSFDGKVDDYLAEMENGFDFAEISAINHALEDIYGPRGARGISLRVGRAIYAEALSNFGALAGFTHQSFQALPLPVKLQIGCQAFSEVLSRISDQITSYELNEDTIELMIHRCPVCWGRSGVDHPICYLATGIIKEGFWWISGRKEFRVNQSQCIAMGDDSCNFVIQKNPLD